MRDDQIVEALQDLKRCLQDKNNNEQLATILISEDENSVLDMLSTIDEIIERKSLKLDLNSNNSKD